MDLGFGSKGLLDESLAVPTEPLVVPRQARVERMGLVEHQPVDPVETRPHAWLETAEPVHQRFHMERTEDLALT